jgi:hypothetical protein
MLVGLFAGAGLAPGCSATGGKSTFETTGGAGGAGGNWGSSSSSSSGMGGEAGGFFIPDAGDAAIDVPVNPCGSKCGPDELCDDFHLGTDDDCDGQSDEGCPCSAGQVQSCFLGDPSYRGTPGCFDGIEKCSENGKWGPCTGGVHATQNCFATDNLSCHAIISPPFLTTDLKSGTGNFSSDALPGTEVWTVTCPDGVNPCPAVSGSSPPDDFKPLQSGEYTVTYTKGLQGGGTASCTYPLFVGAPGLRVELSWEHDLGADGVDLDLHLHRPDNFLPWSIDGADQDCGYGNCTISAFAFGFADTPDWFGAGQPPNPIAWWKDPVFEKNNCYFAPRGVGLEWQQNGKGCHNPRLDLDNITCDPFIMDPDDFQFCAPENINVDFPPKGQWFRIGVQYYDNADLTYDVHPNIKIFCDGALTAELGSKGFYDPEVPITFTSADGANFPTGNRFWAVADVAFRDKVEGECAAKGCVVVPLYTDAATRTPLLMYGGDAESSVGPAYPPPP